MFKMIGGDGREYGPVTVDQLREWILDHRANDQTMVLPEGGRDWQPLGALPEFAAVLAEAARLHAVPPPPPPVVGPAPATPSSLASEEAAATASTPAAPVEWREAGATLTGWAGGELRVLDCLGRAWHLWQRHLLLITGASALAWGIQTLPQLLPQVFGCVGLLASLAVSGAVYGGLSVLILGLVRGEPARPSELFACFDGRFPACLLVFVITGILEEIGLALCILPGVFLSTVWAFSLPLAADRRLGFSQAVQASWRAVMPRFFAVLALLALAFLPLVIFSAYSSARMVGHTMDLLGPLGSLEFGALRERLPELTHHAGRLGLQQQWVLLLNLPFAWTALMTAYEDLFSVRPRPPG
jgi:hypothetical protein